MQRRAKIREKKFKTNPLARPDTISPCRRNPRFSVTARGMSGEQQTLENGDPTSQEEAKAEAEIRALELEVKDMAQRILHFRRTVPQRITKVLESSLAAKRPPVPPTDAAEEATAAGISSDAGAGLEHAESSGATTLLEVDPKADGKIHLLKEKSSKNLSTMPIVLKRMHECIAAIDKLDEYNFNIHEAFKRKRTD
ncbi:hypothetical protein ACLOJK_015536 [Asimina triloba]